MAQGTAAVFDHVFGELVVEPVVGRVDTGQQDAAESIGVGLSDFEKRRGGDGAGQFGTVDDGAFETRARGVVGDAVGKIGPRGAKNRERFDKVIIEGDHFRLLNGAGDVQFSGYIHGEFSGHEPLEDYGLANGCSTIEYENDGAWISVDDFIELRRFKRTSAAREGS